MKKLRLISPGLPTTRELLKHFPECADSINSVRTAKIYSKIGTLILVFFIFTIVSLIFVPWVQNIHGTGKVIVYSPDQRVQSIQAPVDGKISNWHVKEGERVEKGTPIVEISDVDPQIIDRIRNEKEAISTKLQALDYSLKVSSKNLERQKALYGKGLSSKRSLELAELEVAKFQSEVSSVRSELLKVESRLARQSTQSIIAQQDGVIQKIYIPTGDVFVKQGENLAQIVPDTNDRAVELTFNGNDIPLLTVGREVRLQFEGWPAVQFSGWPSVAIGTFSGYVGVIDAVDNGEGKFRAIIFKPPGESWPEPIFLRQGVRVLGWVLLDEVTLGWELWRRFNAFPLTPPQLSKN